MLFNSINFFYFFFVVFVLYWFVPSKKIKKQNVLLLFSSYYFYSCWDWRFLCLLLFSTLLDYLSGINIHNSKSVLNKKIWLWLSISINIGFLGVFKYFNFFVSSFTHFISYFGLHISPLMIKVVLPVGISFYTFNGLSYLIDVYKKRIEPEFNFINYGVFVSFFPLLVAGPIERASHLLPQIKNERVFNRDRAVDGLRQILWGLFKKVVIADNCAEFANQIFNNSQNMNGSTLILGAVFFTFQIYGDFSGYSDIALGIARLLGFDLLKNFSFPYFSRNIAEFWRRWHISLSSWFKDYLYIPLGGNSGNLLKKIRNVFIIFLVSGLWHGANWTFIAWGFLNALFILPSIILKTNRNHLDIVAKGRNIPTIKELSQIFSTFILTVFAWIFFRSENLKEAINFIKIIFSKTTLEAPTIFPNYIFILILFFIIVEWNGREQEFALAKIGLKWNIFFRFSLYYFLIFSLFYFNTGNKQQFIYFQF